MKTTGKKPKGLKVALLTVVFTAISSSTAPPSELKVSSLSLKIWKRQREIEDTVGFFGDLYDPNNNIYDLSEDPYEDNQLLTKKKDAARITFEMAAVVRHIYNKQNFKYCFFMDY